MRRSIPHTGAARHHVKAGRQQELRLRVCLRNGKKRGILVRAQPTEELIRRVGSCASKQVLMGAELIAVEASPGAAPLTSPKQIALPPSLLGGGHGATA